MRNVLNTFENTYTKDLILDGTITVPFLLADSELQRINVKMLEIDFFRYPDTFCVPIGDTVGMMTPCSEYRFEVSYKSSIKHLVWADCIVSEDTAAVKLRELNMLIENIIESKPAYSQLPPARGGYL